jgi:hypothetical protein
MMIAVASVGREELMNVTMYVDDRFAEWGQR